MNDLFTSMEESTEERAAILSAESIAFDEEKRHRDEVSWAMRTFHPGPNASREQMKQAIDAITEYFQLVQKHRGEVAANRLRDDCREAWKARRAES